MSCTAVGQVVTCTSGNPTVAGGSNLSVSYSVAVSSGLANGMTLTNQVVVSQLEGNAVTNATAGLTIPVAGSGNVSTNQLAANWSSVVSAPSNSFPPARIQATALKTNSITIASPVAGPIQTVSPVSPAGSGAITLDPSTGNINFTANTGFFGGVTFEAVVQDPASALPRLVSYTINVIDPAGVVYDSVTRRPVAGVKVEILDETGNPVRNECLSTATPNGPVTGADGRYELLLSTNSNCQTSAAKLFSLRVTNPVGYKPGFSAAIPPQSNSYAPNLGGSIEYIQVQNSAPQGSESTIYYEKFMFVISNLAAQASNGVGQNHLPIDPLLVSDQALLTLSKIGSTSTAEIGDSVLYTLSLTYSNKVGTATENNVVVTDTLPRGFKYIPNSVVVVHGASRTAGDQMVGYTGIGPVLTFHVGALTSSAGSADNVTITYRVRVGVGSQSGDGINRAVANSANGRASNEARYQVKVSDGIFSSTSCVAGKVYIDCNGNRIQDQDDENEMGIPGVRLYMEDGTYLISDNKGKYSICGLKATTHVFKIDQITLPKNAVLAASSNRNASNPDSLFTDLKFGELHRADFIESSCSPEILKQVQARQEHAVSGRDDALLPMMTFQSGGGGALPQRGGVVLPGQVMTDKLFKTDRQQKTIRFDSESGQVGACVTNSVGYKNSTLTSCAVDEVGSLNGSAQ